LRLCSGFLDHLERKIQRANLLAQPRQDLRVLARSAPNLEDGSTSKIC
jgi:hypothetical protein